MAYSDKVIDHYENPRNVGKMDSTDENLYTYTLNNGECFANIYFESLCSHAIPDTHFQNLKHYLTYARFEHKQLLETQNKYQK